MAGIQGIDKSQEEFFQAIRTGDKEKVKAFLLDKSELLHKPNPQEDFLTPLNFAIKLGNYEITDLILLSNQQNPLLDAQAEEDKKSAFHFAIEHGQFKILELLTNVFRTQINIDDENRLTPLH